MKKVDWEEFVVRASIIVPQLVAQTLHSCIADDWRVEARIAFLLVELWNGNHRHNNGEFVGILFPVKSAGEIGARQSATHPIDQPST